MFDENGFSATANPEYRTGQFNVPRVKGSVDDDSFWQKMEELERRSGTLKSAPFKPPSRVGAKVRAQCCDWLTDHVLVIQPASSTSGFQTAATLLKTQQSAPATGLVIGSGVSHKFKAAAPVKSTPVTADVTFQSARDLMQAEQKSTATKQSHKPQARTLDSFGFVKTSGGTAVNQSGKRVHEVIDIDDEPPTKRAKTSHTPASQVPANNNSFRSISGKFSNK